VLDKSCPSEGRPSIGKYVKLSDPEIDASIDAGSWMFAAIALSVEIDW
jgi:hypothetical protein